MNPLHFPYSNRAWNTLVKEAERNTPRGGKNSNVRNSPFGSAVDYTGPVFKHPWFVSPFWNSKKGAWCATIKPGFINGRDPLIVMNIKDVPAGSLVYGNDYGRSSRQLGEGDGTIEVLLTDRLLTAETQPFLSLRSYRDRAAVDDSGDSEKAGSYPLYFVGLGARKPDAPDSLLAQAGNALAIINEEVTVFEDHTLSNESFGNKQLASTDIVLHVDHASIKIGVEGLGGLGNLFLPTVEVLEALDRYGARMFSTSKWMPPPAPTLLDKILGDYVEPNFEEIVIATVYFLSPENGDFPVDQTWTAYVQHSVFWNLLFASLNRIDAPVNTNMTLFTGLVGGIFDNIFNQILGPINEQNAILTAALNTSTMAGLFWTA